MAFIISADNLKQKIKGYVPDKSEDFHLQSAKLADKLYSDSLKLRPENDVILMSGGAASGKTEYVSVYLMSEDVIVLDGTLPSIEGAKIKIKAARKAGKSVSVTTVMPENFQVAFLAFLNRERKFPAEHFFRTHSTSRRTILTLAQLFPDITITIIDSAYGRDGNLSFSRLLVKGRQSLLEVLEQRQYTEDEIQRAVRDAS